MAQVAYFASHKTNKKKSGLCTTATVLSLIDVLLKGTKKPNYLAFFKLFLPYLYNAYLSMKCRISRFFVIGLFTYKVNNKVSTKLN